jgi:hypothetical protein
MKQALTGGAYTAHSVIAAAQRCVNLFPEPMPSGNQYTGTTGQGEPSTHAHYPTPGIRLLGTIGTGPVRGIRQVTTGGVYVVSGDTLYSVDLSNWSGFALGTLTPGLKTPVSMQDNGLDMLIVDGSANGWNVTLAGNTMAPIIDPGGLFVGADRVDFLDTFFIFNAPGTPAFYISLSESTAFDPLAQDTASKEAYSDLLVVAVVAKRLIYLFGTQTTEIWYDAGTTFSTTDPTAATSFQFAAMQSEVFIDHGCAAKYSPAVYDNSVFWLTKDRQGQGIVMMVSGYQTKRVSTYAIEDEIAGYERISDAIGFCYQMAGHTFYVLTFPQADRTWSYDIATGLWHEWLWIDTNGAEHRHRANCFWPVNDTLVVGDWQNGNLYALDNRVFTDNGQPIKRVRAFPHILNDGKRVFYRQFLADMETGTRPEVSPTITSIERVITWLPNIAQMNGVSVGAVDPPFGGVYIDWERGLTYMVGQTGYQKYTTALVTQTALVTVAVPVRFVYAGGLDPLSGDLLLQTQVSGGPGAGGIVSKVDPTTFAVLGTYGTVTSTPSYPDNARQGQDIVCVVCNGVSFGFVKESGFSGGVAGFRVDTMQHCGFFANIVSGSTNNRGSICAGQSGGTSASVFLSWDATTTPAPAVPLYRIDVAASATAYNPATWPATNPGITWRTAGTIPVAAVNPAWPGISVFSLGYDLADGNVLMLVGTSVLADGHHILKLNAATAAVMWNIAIGRVSVDLSGSRINGSLWMIANAGVGAGPTSSYRIDTLTGTLTTQAITGVYAAANSSAQQSDSANSLMLYGGTFNAGTGAPNPVAGTGTFSGGWSFMGGQTVTSTVTRAELVDRLVSLRWSDDRGHSFGSPVSQSIGDAGEYRTSLQWQRLAYARDRVFEISWSVPMRTALQGCWIDVTPAQS